MFIPFYVSGLLNWYVSERKDSVIIRISILMLSAVCSLRVSVVRHSTGKDLALGA